MNFKDIHIGTLINQKVEERGLEVSRICNFLACSEEEIEKMLKQKSLDTHMLLRWSKLLHYDFFRIYTQHLILYAPPSAIGEQSGKIKSILPRFRKNIYTKEIIDFILEQIRTGKMDKKEVIKKYRIPKTTLYKWIEKEKN